MGEPDLAFQLDRIEREVKSLKRELRQKSKLWDTVCSTPWQRAWWFLQGFRLWKVGRWYRKTKDLK
jgi:hypothetical protein